MSEACGSARLLVEDGLRLAAVAALLGVVPALAWRRAAQASEVLGFRSLEAGLAAEGDAGRAEEEAPAVALGASRHVVHPRVRLRPAGWPGNAPCANRLALPVLYCVTLCAACFLHFLQYVFLPFGTFTCAQDARRRQGP